MGNLFSNEVEPVIPGTLMYKVKDNCLKRKPNQYKFSKDAKVEKEDTFVFDQSYEGDTEDDYEYRILWGMVLYWIVTHSLSFYGLYLAFTSAKWKTNIYAISLFYIFLLGIPAGAHRLWSHRCYKAKAPLKAILCFLCSVAASGSIWSWAVIHRIHHKYSDTNADPVNSKRGFWFSHIGWTMQTTHPKVVEKAKNVEISDLENDIFVRFNRDNYSSIIIIFCYVLPALIPVYYWQENVLNSLLICSFLRHILQLHGTFSINSFAHLYGDRPYNVKIPPTQNFWANLYTFGEGFHNYHHSFPWDYRASEFGWKWNMTTIFLDFMKAIGWAYDCKTPSTQIVENTKRNNILKNGYNNGKLTENLNGFKDDKLTNGNGVTNSSKKTE